MLDAVTTNQHMEPRPGRYAVMTMDEQLLLVPQHELVSLEPAQDLKRFPQGPRRAVGHISLGQEQVPVYCLDHELALTAVAPAKRRVCTLLQSPQHGLFGLLCDQVTTLSADATNTRPLPECMRTPGSPIRDLILDGERALCTSTAADLAILIMRASLPAAGQETEDVVDKGGG